ncbi:bifunctional riboflavin kinase/FAD synthetase [Legionella spiritensis]|uniref:bifunctional riboflavin kinase/FAD synthetase n=1 Tax=Legionella spiritensis TaxID=452 RepID=UPI000F70DD9F|nr:bifunctional riboflavin kinase/FAD synthetase [Legionella spiritensis]VEG90517.1 riboflavin biosynthesis protein RibF (riboflavin kinase/FMN adenylyltransferase) [Legionella spiritensis]
MKLLRGSFNPSLFATGAVVTIGNFDGVHTGHQALLGRLYAEARKRSLPAVVVLFEPQPGEFFQQENAPARLTTLREKLTQFKRNRIDFVYCLRFNKQLAELEPEAFIERYFFSLLQARYLLVGNDFRFGRGRRGDAGLLTQKAEHNHCVVETFPDHRVGDLRVSSTKIRELLAQGNLEQASVLLGRLFSLCGRVLAGEGRGRQWGIPTANLAMQRHNIPLKGVFCVHVIRQNGERVNGVANLGSRPTVDGSKVVLEVHLFDFKGDLYGEFLQVYFLHKLRDEIKFSSVEELIDQIHNDVVTAKAKFVSGRLVLNAITE